MMRLSPSLVVCLPFRHDFNKPVIKSPSMAVSNQKKSIALGKYSIVNQENNPAPIARVGVFKIVIIALLFIFKNRFH